MIELARLCVWLLFGRFKSRGNLASQPQDTPHQPQHESAGAVMHGKKDSQGTSVCVIGRIVAAVQCRSMMHVS